MSRADYDKVDLRDAPSMTLEASKAREKFRDLIDAAVSQGARVTITRSGKPMAAVVPLRDLERLHAADAALDRRMIAAREKGGPEPEMMPFESFHEQALEEPAESPAAGEPSGSNPTDLPIAAIVGALVERYMTGIVCAGAQRSAERVAHIQPAGEAHSASEVEAEVAEIVSRSFIEVMEDPESLRKASPAFVRGYDPEEIYDMAQKLAKRAG
jgi:prevent-host-death family protein